MAHVVFPMTLLIFIWTFSCFKLIANTTSVSHGVPCWLAALFDLLTGVDVLEIESKDRKRSNMHLFTQIKAYYKAKPTSFHTPKGKHERLAPVKCFNSCHITFKTGEMREFWCAWNIDAQTFHHLRFSL